MRTIDPFPTDKTAENRHLRIRYQPAIIDPMEIHLARIEAQREQAKADVARGKTKDADPADLRGIPCIARGVGGTSPGTNPATAVLRLDAA